MTRRRLINRVGPSVRGKDFFAREWEVERMLELLRTGHHISLAAQRRTGKTSLLREVERRLEGEMTPLYVDLEDSSDEAEAIAAIVTVARPHQAQWGLLAERFKNLLGSVEEVGGDVFRVRLRAGLAGDWRESGSQILKDLTRPGPVVLLLDELPILLVRLLRDGRERAEMFLSWLRRACQETPDLRIVITGSIGLHPIAARAGLSGTLNHYNPFVLEPWTPAVAMECLDALAGDQVAWGDGAREEVVDCLGECIPFHVQLVFQSISEDAGRRKASVVSAADVRRVYAQRVLSTHGHIELAHMEERLRYAVRPEHHELTLDLLTEAAVNAPLTAERAARMAATTLSTDPVRGLHDILLVLEHDGYLQRTGAAWTFPSRLLRDWWKGRYAAFYKRSDPHP